uniref:Uncharacterized protein n=1 Tax=Arundo donax TaxID=35708 RepID=A0A0A8Y9Q2_ARUDO
MDRRWQRFEWQLNQIAARFCKYFSN